MVGLEPQGSVNITSGGVQMHVVSVPAGSRQQHGVWEAAEWFQGSWNMVVSLSRQPCHVEAARTDTDRGQVVVTTVTQHSEQHSQQEPKALDITPEVWEWSSHPAVSTGSDVRTAECWHTVLQAALGQKGRWPGNRDGL